MSTSAGIGCGSVPLRVAVNVDLGLVSECISCAAAIEVGPLDGQAIPTRNGAGDVVTVALNGSSRLTTPLGATMSFTHVELREPALHSVPNSRAAVADLVFYLRDVNVRAGALAFDAVIVQPVLQVTTGMDASLRGVSCFAKWAEALAANAGGGGGGGASPLLSLFGAQPLEALQYVAPIAVDATEDCGAKQPVPHYLLMKPAFIHFTHLRELLGMTRKPAASNPAPDMDVLRLKSWASRTTVTARAAGSSAPSMRGGADTALTRALQCVRIDPERDVAGDHVRLRPGLSGGRTLAEELAEGSVTAADLGTSGPGTDVPKGGIAPGDVEGIIAIVVGVLFALLVGGFLFATLVSAIAGSERYELNMLNWREQGGAAVPAVGWTT